MENCLRIAEGFTVPLDAVTRTFGILAMRGAGKTNLAAVMAEEMFEAGVPFIIIDPVGSWWGLRSKADGSPGLPLPIFGGEHADVPLDRGAGELLADLIIERRLSCVVDLSAFDSEGAKKTFLLAFARRLFIKNREPLHLFLEEADDYIPQRPMRDEAQLLRAWENIVRRGRQRGLGLTMITQRSAALNKNVLTQIETLFVLRTTGPHDRRAIADWVSYQGQSHDVVDSLPGLADGEAWCWSPQWLGKMERIRVRRRHTYDSGATPKLSTRARPVATLADVDLPELSKQWAVVLERAKSEDPSELKRRIAKLEEQLRRRPAGPSVEMPVIVEVPVFTEADRAEVERLKAEVHALIARVGTLQDAIEARGTGGIGTRPSRGSTASLPAKSAHKRPARAATALGRCERALLAVLAQRRRPTTDAQLAVLSGYSRRSSGFANALSALRAGGLVEGQRGALAATAVGIATAGPVDPMPSGRALLAFWSSRLGKAEGAFLDALYAAYPKALTKGELSRLTGYSQKSSAFANSLSKLRVLELIAGSSGEGYRAGAIFFE